MWNFPRNGEESVSQTGAQAAATGTKTARISAIRTSTFRGYKASVTLL
jgi:hypothetical protein